MVERGWKFVSRVGLGSCLAAIGAAQTPATSARVSAGVAQARPQQTFFAVDPESAGVHEFLGAPASAAPPSGARATASNANAANPQGAGNSTQTVQLPAGLMWERSDIFWIGKIVSLGNHGTQVFTEFDSGIDHAEILSSFDENPAAPVWSTPSAADLAQAQCDSSEANDEHVTIHQIVTGGDQLHRQAVVSHFTSSSATPTWTYAFPQLIGSSSKVRMSADGQVIAAGIHDNFTNTARIAFFSPSSGTPVATLALPFFAQLRAFELSSDGSTLYVSNSALGMVIDVATRATLLQFALPTALDCHAISGDGRVIAYGTFGTVEIWERNTSGGYSHTWSASVPGTCVCARVALSDNGATLVYGFNFFDTNLHVRIEALDVATKSVTMSDDAYGTGTLQNVVGDISVDASGQRFAVGLWGDAGGQCPELRLYRRDSSTPARLVNLPGSVFDVDMSADGERVAVASKSVHANTLSSGGTIGLYAFNREDLRASGVPVAGSRITFQLRGPAFSPAALLWSDGLAATPIEFPTIGTLYLRRTSITSQAAGTADADGIVQLEFALPSGASQIGQSLYFQGFFSSPRRLTTDWVAVTILP